MSESGDTENTAVYILVGRARRVDERPGDPDAGDRSEPFNVLLTAPNEDEAVTRALAALAGQGYGQVALDRIGVIAEEPEDPTFAAAYWNAIDGEVAVIAFHG